MLSRFDSRPVTSPRTARGPTACARAPSRTRSPAVRARLAACTATASSTVPGGIRRAPAWSNYASISGCPANSRDARRHFTHHRPHGEFRPRLTCHRRPPACRSERVDAFGRSARSASTATVTPPLPTRTPTRPPPDHQRKNQPGCREPTACRRRTSSTDSPCRAAPGRRRDMRRCQARLDRRRRLLRLRARLGTMWPIAAHQRWSRLGTSHAPGTLRLCPPSSVASAGRTTAGHGRRCFTGACSSRTRLSSVAYGRCPVSGS